MFSKIYKTKAFQSGAFYAGFFVAGTVYVGGVVTAMTYAERLAKQYGDSTKLHVQKPASSSEHIEPNDIKCLGCNSSADYSNPFEGPNE